MRSGCRLQARAQAHQDRRLDKEASQHIDLQARREKQMKRNEVAVALVASAQREPLV